MRRSSIRERIKHNQAIQERNNYAWYDPIFNCAIVQSRGHSKKGNAPHHYFASLHYMLYGRGAFSHKMFRLNGDPVGALHRSKKVEAYYQQRYAQEWAQYMAEG